MALVPRSGLAQAGRYLVVLLVMLLGGCTVSIEAYPERPFDNVVSPLATPDSIKVSQTFYSLGSEDQRQNYRNQVIAERIAAINISYRIFEQQLFREGTVRNIATDWALLGLAGAGSTIASSGTQQMLAAISGGLVGARAAFDKNALFDRTLPSLVAKMQASRRLIEERLKNGMQLDTKAYGIIDTLGDLDSYYIAGTLPGAILNIAEDAGALKTQIQQRRVFSAKSLDDAAKALIPLLTGGSGTLDVAKVKQLRTCFTIIGLPSDILVVDFLYGGEFIVERTKVLGCMRALPASMTSGPPAPRASPRTGSDARIARGGASVPRAGEPLVDPGALTDRLIVLLKDPTTGKATEERVNLVVSCYPPGLNKKTTLPDQLVTDRMGFAREKKSIIDCVLAANADRTLDPAQLSEQLKALLQDPTTGLATRARVDRAIACYPATLDKRTTLPSDLVNNKAGFAREKKAIIDCMQKT